MPDHRKLTRHRHEPGDLHELTFSCDRRLPLLTNETRPSMLSESVDRAMNRHAFDLIAFVFMPAHVHLLVAPRVRELDVPALLKAIKRPFSFRGVARPVRFRTGRVALATRCVTVGIRT